MKDFGLDPDEAWDTDMKNLQKHAELARFSIAVIALHHKKMTKAYNESNRSTDVKKEMSFLRVIVGDKEEKNWVAKPLLERCVAMAMKKK